MHVWQDLINTKGRIMGVDFGDTRTGLAISDESRFLASGIGYISVGGLIKTAEKTAELAKENRVSAIVVGLPVNMNGSEGPRAERAKEFAEHLGTLVDVSHRPLSPPKGSQGPRFKGEAGAELRPGRRQWRPPASLSLLLPGKEA